MSIRFHHPDDGCLVGRDSFIVAFFTHGGYANIVDHVPFVFERWLSLLSPGALTWTLIGAHAKKYHPFDSASLMRVRDYLTPARAAQRKNLYVEVAGGYAHCPDFRFTVSGRAQPDEDRESCLVELRFPADFPHRLGLPQTILLVMELAQRLPFTSGYASPGLVRGWEIQAHMEQAASKLCPLAMRFPGYDLDENQWTALQIGQMSRGARWITLLGKELVDALGGKDALIAQLSSPVSVADAGAGVIICAGQEPELADGNRGHRPVFLSQVAAAIEPVTFFGDLGPFSGIRSDSRAEELMERWERRFFL